MSAEKHTGKTSERYEQSHSQELDQHKERLEHSRHEAANRARSTHEQAKAEAARAVEQEAVSGKELPPVQENRQPSPHHTRSEEKIHSFNTTMHHVRQQLSKPDQILSKIAHQPVVEKVSEITGKTIARPSGVIGGTVAALFGILSVYGVAKFAGFSLTGSEMPLLLLIGFVAGLLIEWAVKATKSLFSAQSTAK